MSIFYSAILLNFKVLYLELKSEIHSKFYIWGKYFHLIGIILSLGKNWYYSGKSLDLVTDDCQSRTSCFRLSIIMSKC